MKEAGALFAEDFDAPDAPDESHSVEPEPLFSALDLAAAREAGWREGREAGRNEAASGDAAAARHAVASFAASFDMARASAAARAEANAEAIARLLLDSLAAMFPALCARYGDAEVRAIIRTLLPSLTQETAITVRAHPGTAGAIAREIACLEPELVAHVEIIECDSMPRGDVRVAWRNGTATRDACSLWQQVAAVLAPAGLLHPDAAIKETVDGD
jgi:flagellar assembly protein FliH